jgi:ketosteroid isomerase-like protein
MKPKTSKTKPVVAAQVRRIIDKHNTDLMRWYAAGDIDSVASVFAVDAWQMPPNAAPLIGREAIRKFWKDATVWGQWEFTLKAEAVDVSESLAVERGKYILRFTAGPASPPGMTSFEDRGNYLVHWHHEADNEWRIIADAPVSEKPLPIVQPISPNLLPMETKKNNSDEDIKYINRMRSEIQKAENTPTDIEPLRRHSASDIVLIPDGISPVSEQENALNMMKQLWAIFEVKTEYHSEEVKIVGDMAIDRGWAKETLKSKKTNELTENRSNYLWISKKDKNGIWKQTYVIWNKRPE